MDLNLTSSNRDLRNIPHSWEKGYLSDIGVESKVQVIEGWTRTRKTTSCVFYPKSEQEVRRVLEFCVYHGCTLALHGKGYSFDDVIFNDQGIILRLQKLNKILEWNSCKGLMTVQAGVTVGEVYEKALPFNWYLPACPGGQTITIGGCFGNNVHGKDAFKYGNFINTVQSFKLMTASGEVLTIDRQSHGEIFNATAGGIGLLGVVIELTLQLTQVPSPFVTTQIRRVKNLKELLAVADHEGKHRDFVICWVDAFSKGKNLGRGIVASAQWVRADLKTTEHTVKKSLRVPTHLFGIIPYESFWLLFRPFARPFFARIFNWAVYWLNFSRISYRPRLYTKFNFIHSKVPDAQSLTRPYGFIEFQFIVPEGRAEESLTHILQLSQAYGCQSLLCGIKKHLNDPGLISFALDGYAMSIDLQLRGRDKQKMYDYIIALCKYLGNIGAKIYLAKDQMTPAEFFQQMYPQLPRFLEIKKSLDPKNLFASDMYRRLFKGKDAI